MEEVYTIKYNIENEKGCSIDQGRMTFYPNVLLSVTKKSKLEWMLKELSTTSGEYGDQITRLYTYMQGRYNFMSLIIEACKSEKLTENEYACLLEYMCEQFTKCGETRLIHDEKVIILSCDDISMMRKIADKLKYGPCAKSVEMRHAVSMQKKYKKVIDVLVKYHNYLIYKEE